MKSKYHSAKIEPKWQKYWEQKKLHQAKDFAKKPKDYLLVEFPYPSGDGLHVGHCRPYIALDVVARKKRMEGKNVLFPIGWDAFGLPTENYAIKTGIHPKIATEKNTARFKEQQKKIGLSFDWSREINTTDPEYYKWTQWIFLQLFKKRLAYKAKMLINWCPSCKIGLANEEVVDGKCERCGQGVTKKEKEQWMLKITKYADRLLEDLDKPLTFSGKKVRGKVDYLEKVKIMQKEWIGRSEGTQFEMPIFFGDSGKEIAEKLEVFTTRIDTVFGMTYVVLSAEHPLVQKITTQKQKKQVEQYVKEAKNKMERERIAAEKEKTGVFSGSYALNIFNEQKIPIYISDYVLMIYGTGVIMAVPAHDERDYFFAKEYNLPIVEVIKPRERSSNIEKEAFIEDGVLVNSEQFSGISSSQARDKMTEWLTKQRKGKKAIYYKLRDWVFSRQHYWGEPIPLVFCENCAVKIKNLPRTVPTEEELVRGQKSPKQSLRDATGQAKIKNNEFNDGELLNPGWISVPEKDLPVELPAVKNYKPTQTGESPLAAVEKWVKIKCPKCGGPARRETDTMPNWAGSNWYYLAYLMRGIFNFPRPRQAKRGGQFPIFKYKKVFKYWMPVDWYNGGMEHTTLHLLYSRFIYKFLWDIGAVPKSCGPEPYKKRTSHGVVLGEGGIKMSKSRGNVIVPDEVVKQYGADTLRLYEMFMGPFDQMIVWDSKGVLGARRFLEKVWKMQYELKSPNDQAPMTNCELERLLHRTIKKVSEDIEEMKFNTAVSALMILANEMERQQNIPLICYSSFLILLSPFAPHISEELWEKLGHRQSIFLERWPQYDEKLIKEEQITLVLQINGKVRDKIEAPAEIGQTEAEKMALSAPKIQKWLAGKPPKKIIFIKGRLVNIVI